MLCFLTLGIAFVLDVSFQPEVSAPLGTTDLWSAKASQFSGSLFGFVGVHGKLPRGLGFFHKKMIESPLT